MAKIKIRGQQDMIAIPQSDALRLKKMKENGEEGNVQAGIFYGQLKDVLGIIFDEPRIQYEDTNLADYYSARSKMLALPLEERVKQQKGLYHLVLGAYKFDPDDLQKKKDVASCNKFLQEHPYRMWMDVTLWIAGWGMKKHLADKNAVAILGRVLAVDAGEERDKLAEMASLTPD